MALPTGIQIWTPNRIYRLLTDDRMDAVPSYFLDTFFTEEFYSGSDEIVLAELPQADRKMAPFVLPTEMGKPIFNAKAEKVKALTPPYIKPKDAVRPEDAKNVRASEVLRGQPLTLQQRFDLRTAEVAAYHLRAIRIQIAWMAARAFIDGQVTIKYGRDQGQAFPEVTITFGRAAGHTVVLSGDFWSDPDYLILDDVQEWADTMRQAVRGGFPTVMLVGSQVAPVFRKNKQILAEMDQTVRGNDVNIRTGLINTAEPLSYIGTFGAGIEVYSYKDEVENSNGTMVDILSPKDILLIAPGATGVKAYGAIYDVDALQSGQAMATDIFSKQFKSDDPGELFLMSQSAPLPIPLYPNRTLKATVLA